MDLTVAGGANILFGPDPTFFGQPENFKRLAMSLTPNKKLGLMLKAGVGSEDTAPPPSIVVVQNWSKC